MRPDFSCGVHNLECAPNNPEAAGRAACPLLESFLRTDCATDLHNARLESGRPPGTLEDLVNFNAIAPT